MSASVIVVSIARSFGSLPIAGRQQKMAFRLRPVRVSGRLLPDRFQRDVRRAVGNRTGGQARQFVGEAVVDVAVMRFVGTDHQHHVAQRGIVGQTPVTLGDFRGGNVRTAALIDLGEIMV